MINYKRKQQKTIWSQRGQKIPFSHQKQQQQQQQQQQQIWFKLNTEYYNAWARK